ncbi:ABC transporter permease [Pararhodobacter aggregans]|uniref:ABC transporter permease n=1 Tax=Pararhodobacter aggregans TaxID=404875 RepID=A0A2T7USR6_9RHOB|nr:ABC transporter permease [Pararhodobacter aggregans]PTX03526.1 peptide/nickel transport system permease protein [Pararhodobacter aggregans]PVE47810.1 ABC transporter permease [Pararhodobacter aggregans]
MTLMQGSAVRSFVVARIASGLVSILFISFLVFLGTALLPGDAATAMLGQEATPELVESLRQALGLDQPLLIRYLDWLWDALHGDFGVSLSNGQPAMAMLLPRLENSLILAFSAAVIVLPLAISIGLFAAIKKGRPFDTMSGLVSALFLSMPSFMIGYVLIYVFAVEFRLFPAVSSVRASTSLTGWVWALTLPVLTLVLVAQSHVLKVTRAAVLGVMGSDYILMAETKGIPRIRIILLHALPNALSSIVSICMITMAHLIVDVVVIEAVFSYPGMGKLMVDAVAYRDIPVVQACGVLFSAIFVVLNMLADLLGVLVNPRQRLPRRGA